jgi:hypothetical protein
LLVSLSAGQEQLSCLRFLEQATEGDVPTVKYILAVSLHLAIQVNVIELCGKLVFLIMVLLRTVMVALVLLFMGCGPLGLDCAFQTTGLVNTALGY